ncbi:MAG: putative metal-binding motif-containing protein [Bradymonadaceae bacterium]
MANRAQADLDGDQIGGACDGDIDGDGGANGRDCAPEDPAIGPSASEQCDATDHNCNGTAIDVGQLAPGDIVGHWSFQKTNANGHFPEQSGASNIGPARTTSKAGAPSVATGVLGNGVRFTGSEALES